MEPSCVSGAIVQPLIGETIGRHFDRICADWSDELALVAPHQGIRRTNAERTAEVLGAEYQAARRRDRRRRRSRICAGQIAHYKVPRYVRFVDEFPMTVTGKVQKFVLREQMIVALELAEMDTA